MSKEVDIWKKTVANIGIQGSARIFTFGLQTLSGLVVPRYLSAQDYGVVGFAMILIGFLGRFNDLGLGSAIVQRKEMTDRGLDTCFTLRMTCGVTAFMVAWLLAPLIAGHFGDPAVQEVIRVLSLTFVVGILGFLPNFILMRNLAYEKLVWPPLLGAIIRVALVCYLAINGYGYWSIAFAGLFAALVEALGFFLLLPRPMRLALDFRIARDLLGFSIPLFGSGLLVFALFNLDNFVVGAISGAVVLGYYSLALTWGAMSSRVVYEVIHAVMFPTMARLQDDPQRLRHTFLKLIEQLGIFGVLGNLVLLVCAEEFLVLVLGRGTDKWLPALLPLQILCVYGIVRMLLEPLGNVLVALGRSRLIFRGALVAGLLELVLLYPAIKWGGIELVAVAVTLSYSVQVLIYWPFLRDELKLRPSDLLDILVPVLCCAVLAATVALMASHLAAFGVYSLLLKAVVTVGMFTLCVGFWTRWKWLAQWRVLILRLRSS